MESICVAAQTYCIPASESSWLHSNAMCSFRVVLLLGKKTGNWKGKSMVDGVAGALQGTVFAFHSRSRGLSELYFAK